MPLPAALLLLLALLSASLSGCAGLREAREAAPLPDAAAAGTGAAEVAAARPGVNTLGAGDLVEVRVFQESDLTGVWRLSSDGTIDYPLCGKVKLAGLTPSEASDALTQCLRQGYLRSPQVSVLVRESSARKVFVIGEVAKPGTYPYEENMSVVQAVALAGGFTRTAAQNGTVVTRRVSGREERIRVPVADIALGNAPDFLLLPGDIVVVPESLF